MADNDLRVGNKAKNLMALEAKGFKIQIGRAHV